MVFAFPGDGQPPVGGVVVVGVDAEPGDVAGRTDLSEVTDLAAAGLPGATERVGATDLPGADVTGAGLTNAGPTGAGLTGAGLTGAGLTGAGDVAASACGPGDDLGQDGAVGCGPVGGWSGPPSPPACPPIDEDDPEPDVLPGGGWAAHDLSARRGGPRTSVPGPPHASIPPAESADRTVARAVAGVLAVWRMHRGLRQRDAAPLLGVTQAQLSRLERGRATVSIDLLGRVAEVTGSRFDVTIVPVREGRAVDRSVLDGLQGGRRIQVVVVGPSARGSRPPRGRRSDRGRRTRPAGPIS